MTETFEIWLPKHSVIALGRRNCKLPIRIYGRMDNVEQKNFHENFQAATLIINLSDPPAMQTVWQWRYRTPHTCNGWTISNELMTEESAAKQLIKDYVKHAGPFEIPI